MGMKVSSLPFLLFLPRRHDNAVSCINSRVLPNAIPHRERKEKSTVCQKAGKCRQMMAKSRQRTLLTKKEKMFYTLVRRFCCLIRGPVDDSCTQNSPEPHC